MSTHTTRSRVAARFAPFGETVFAEISRLALQHNAVNLGQGFPDFEGPDFVKDAAVRAIRDEPNQYARTCGIPPLNEAIADRFARDAGVAIDPDREITVTAGCTEALAASFLGLLNPGDEVILFEPFYDSYRACCAMAGATPRFVTLHPPDFALDETQLRRAFSDRTRAILINTPHNPTGKVFTRAELQLIAELCLKHDAIALTDEVYEHLVYDGEHIRPATLDGMAGRTVTMSSLGKTFSLTGWKIGWAIGPPDLTQGVRAAHQYLTFASATPLQHAAAAALRAPDNYYDTLVATLRRRRDALVDGLTRAGFPVYRPDGGYFVMADHRPFGFESDVAFCKHLIETVGVAAIPPSAFYHDADDGRHMARFAFCKTDETVAAALQRLEALR